MGMLSKMGGRVVHYYSDDLTEMLLDDILADTVRELQAVEQKQKNTFVVNESKQLAENLLKHIVDFESEQNLVDLRWNSLKQVKQPKVDLGDAYYEVGQPKPIKFNQEDSFTETSNKQYVNPFEQQPGLSLNA